MEYFKMQNRKGVLCSPETKSKHTDKLVSKDYCHPSHRPEEAAYIC